MVAPVSTAALIISTTTPNGPTALLNFILEMTFFTIRMVIIIIIIIIISLFKEDYILSKHTYLTYGPL